MSFSLTPTGSDNFTPNANPVNPAKWVIFSGETAMQALSGFASPTVTGGVFCGAQWITGPSSADQYASIVLHSFTGLAAFDTGVDLYLRVANDFSNSYLLMSLNNDGAGNVSVQFGDTVSHQTVSEPFVSGDTYTFIAIGLTTYALRNGVQIGTPQTVASSGGVIHVGMDMFVTTNISDAQAGNFVVGTAASVYSVPDCRVAPYGPNASRTIQGTKTYDVQTSSNHAVPSTDSRASVPVDPRVAAIIPENSRTPGTFGPGE